MDNISIQVQPTPQAVAEVAAERIITAASEAISVDGRFSIAISTCETSLLLCELLASDRYSRRMDWPHWAIYFTDELCIPPAQPGSNFRLLSETLLDQVPVQRENIHRIKGELEPLPAAIEYGKMLKQTFADAGPHAVVLELGAEGEIAGLFPNTQALAETHHRCAENYVAKISQWRVTMTAPFINRARLLIVLAAGDKLSRTVAQALEGDRDPNKSPAQLLNPEGGQLAWILDAAAAGMNDDD